MSAQVLYLENALTPQNRIVHDVEPCSIQSLAPEWNIPFVAFLNGEVILRAEWDAMLNSGQSLLFIDVNAIPQGGGGGGSNPLQMVLMIAVMIYAPQFAFSMFGAEGATAAAFAVSGIGIATTMGITMVGMALISAIIPPPQPTSPQTAAALAAASPTYNLQAQGNTARLEAAIPEHFGRLKAFPDFAAQPYQEFSGNDQYLYQLLCIGRGYYSIEGVYIQDTPIANFDDITYEIIPPNGVVTLFPTDVISSIEVSGQTLTCIAATYSQSGTTVTVTQTAHGYGTAQSLYLDYQTGGAAPGTFAVMSTPTADTFTVISAGSLTTSGAVNVQPWVGPFIASASGTTANFLGIDLVATKGLYYAQDNGSLATVSTDIEIEAQQVDLVGSPIGGWVVVSASSAQTPWSDWTYSTVGFTQTTSYDADWNPYITYTPPANTPTQQYQLGGSANFLGIGGGNPQTRTCTLLPGIEQFSGATTTPQRYSRRYPVTPGRYQVRVRRTDIEQTSTRYGHAMIWGGLRAYLQDIATVNYSQAGAVLTVSLAAHGYTIGDTLQLNISSGTATSSVYTVATTPDLNTFTLTAPTATTSGTATIQPNFGDVTLMAMRMRASSNLSAQSSRAVNVICTRKLPIWNGTTWSANTATTSIAWALAYACKAIGMTDTQIDLAALLTLDATWTARGDSFNARFDSFLSFWEAVTKMAGAGRAKPYMQAGVMRFMRDQAQTVPVALFSMRNIVKGSFTVDYLMPTFDTADAVNVGYFDAVSWAPARVQAKVTGSTVQKPVKVDIFGVTSRDQAYREGMYLAATNRYRRKSIKFSTEMEGFIPSFGDLIAIQHDMPAWGQGGEVTAWDSATRTLTMSEPPVYGTGTHYIGLRKRDGSVDGPYAITAGLQANQVILASAPSFTPYTGMGEERTHYAFGWADTWRQLARVLAVKPQGLYQVAIECVNEDPNVHTADTGVTTPVMITSQLAGFQNAPSVIGLSTKPSPTLPAQVVASWQPAAWANHYLVEQSYDGVIWSRLGDITANNFTFKIAYVASYLRVAAVGVSKGAWTQITVPAPAAPSNVSGLIYSLGVAGLTISWNDVLDVDRKDYELRNGASWAVGTSFGFYGSNSVTLPPQLAGSATWWVAARNQSLLESAIPASVTIGIVTPLAPAVTSGISSVNYQLSWTVPVSAFMIDHYEIRIGTVWSSGSTIGTTKATTFQSAVNFSGTQNFMVAAIDTAGNVGVAGGSAIVIVIPSAPVVTTQVIDNNVLFYWNDTHQTLPLKTTEIRKGLVFATATVIGQKNGLFTTLFETTAGTYTYWIVNIDAAGNYGTPTSIAATMAQPPDYVLKANYNSTFSGTLSSAVMNNGAVILPVNTAETWASHFTSRSWSSPQAQITAGYPIFIEPAQTGGGYYEEIIDYGTVLASCQVSVSIVSAVISGAPSSVCTISTSSDNATWTNYVGLTQVYATGFRYIKVHIAVNATATDLLQISAINVKLSTKLKNDAGSVACVSTDNSAAITGANIGGTTVLFAVPFISVTSITLTPQGTTTPVTAIYDFIGTTANPLGFKVYLYNSAGARVSGTVSWSAKGY